MFGFHVYGQILNSFSCIFSKKEIKSFLSYFKNAKIDIVTNLWLFIKVWLNIKKSITIILFETIWISYIYEINVML